MTSIRLSLNSPKQTRALLSIRPEFAAAIFCGEKKYEFRRRIFSSSVQTILVYVTAPISRVAGEFDVRAVIKAPVKELWSRTRAHAGIDEDRFFQYFYGREEGYAIVVGNPRPYDMPYCPLAEHGIKPPQSFVYLEE